MPECAQDILLKIITKVISKVNFWDTNLKIADN
jgi:hypothetical protein